MPRILRVNGADGDPVGTADSPDRLRSLLNGLDPGRYHVDEISADPLPSRHTSRRRGIGIKHPDGTVTLDPDPWPGPLLTGLRGLRQTVIVDPNRSTEPGGGKVLVR
jgi:hypothetical protein